MVRAQAQVRVRARASLRMRMDARARVMVSLTLIVTAQVAHCPMENMVVKLTRMGQSHLAPQMVRVRA